MNDFEVLMSDGKGLVNFKKILSNFHQIEGDQPMTMSCVCREGWQGIHPLYRLHILTSAIKLTYIF